MISSSIAGNIGGFLTFLEIIFSAIFGMFLLKNLNIALVENMKALSQGKISQRDFSRMNISMALGAILLIIPGFFTDIIGILLQFEFVGVFIANKFIKKETTYNSDDEFNTQKGDDDVIDVEIIEHTHTIDKHS
jgi:2-isopropylmalate synthase/UPF0716 protein FxsA